MLEEIVWDEKSEREKELEQRLISVMKAYEKAQEENRSLKLELSVHKGAIDRLKKRLNYMRDYLIDATTKETPGGRSV